MFHTRTSTHRVTFQKSFLMPGMTEPCAPGTFTVTAEEELLDALTWTGWREVSLTIELPRKGAWEHVSITGRELRLALILDSGQTVDPPASPAAAATAPIPREFHKTEIIRSHGNAQN